MADEGIPPTVPRGAIPPNGADPPDTICRFGKRTLDKMSWLAPLVNNTIGDRLNLELRHEQLFFICGERVVDDIGYGEKSARFSEADYGKPIHSLDDMKRKGYWLVGRTFHAQVMREALRRQQDGLYYNFLSNQCQDWADRLKRNAERIERELGLHKAAASLATGEAETLERFTRLVPPTEPASIWMGLLSLGLGIFALMSPLLMADAFGLVLGLVFIASGVAHIAYAFHGRDWRNMATMGMVGLLYLLGGGLFVLNHNLAIMATSSLIGLVLGLQGIVHIGLGLRGRPFRRWAGTLAAGLLMLVTALMLWTHWPADGDRFFGLMVGMCLIVGGLATVWLSWTTRHEEDHPSAVA